MVTYLLAVSLTGWFHKNLRKEVRGIIGIIVLAGATLHIAPIGLGVAVAVELKLFGEKLRG